MKLDLEALAAAAALAIFEKIADDLSNRIERVVTCVLDRRAENGLLPLSKLKGCSAPAARMFLGRHADLRALAIPVGKRLFFRKSDWDAWLLAQRRGS